MVKEMNDPDKDASSSTLIKASEIPRASATGNPFFSLFFSILYVWLPRKYRKTLKEKLAV